MAPSSRAAGSVAAAIVARRVAWAVLWLLALAVVLHFLWGTFHKYAPQDPNAYGMFWSRRAWLWTHLAGGTLTALLGPWQFIARLRNAYPRAHRWTGRVYLSAMLVACVGAAGLIATTPGGFALQAAFAATALAWLCTALPGYIAIRAGRTQDHRRWMLRNYIVTLAPMVFRLSIQVPGMMALAHPAVLIPTLLWLSWAAPLLVYELTSAIARWVRRAPTPQAELA
ncbi:DUF2306 domain-containing protein [Lysobacter sp. cf310]|uniref:DUF2306 domain-containing protein n=1 Tax=Lysobacter sp. cf310 TaxID=1761790 RepID=UPI0008F30D66|nr:DUF2306 domain-containing protein [Lysobacter sp. cf310]SFK69581.1 Predicted membrane protein [Lysobacter sp. cf310]